MPAAHQPNVRTTSGALMLHRGELDLMTRYPYWEFFGTSSFPGVVCPSPTVRYKTVFAFLREVAALADMDFPSLVWVLRDEDGEQTHRPHFHWLIGGSRLPQNPSTNFRLMAMSRRHCGGWSRCAIYNRELSGAEYISTCLTGEGTKAAHHYETEKFGTTERPPILSRSLLAYLKRSGRRAPGESRKPQVRTTFGERARTVTGDRSAGIGRGYRFGTADKHQDGLGDSSYLYRLGRHPYGVGKGGAPG